MGFVVIGANRQATGCNVPLQNRALHFRGKVEKGYGFTFSTVTVLPYSLAALPPQPFHCTRAMIWNLTDSEYSPNRHIGHCASLMEARSSLSTKTEAFGPTHFPISGFRALLGLIRLEMHHACRLVPWDTKPARTCAFLWHFGIDRDTLGMFGSYPY